MTTINLRIGGSEPLVFRPEQPDGTMPDLTGGAMQLRIGAGSTCIIVPGAVTDDGFEVDLNDIALPPRLYRASVWFNWGSGWRWQGDVLLNVTGGC